MNMGGSPVFLPSTELEQGFLDECQLMQERFWASGWWKSNRPPLEYNRIFFFYILLDICIVFKFEKHGLKLRIPREVTCVHCAASIPDADTENRLYSCSVIRLDEGQTFPVLQGRKPGVVEELHQEAQGSEPQMGRVAQQMSVLWIMVLRSASCAPNIRSVWLVYCISTDVGCVQNLNDLLSYFKLNQCLTPAKHTLSPLRKSSSEKISAWAMAVGCLEVLSKFSLIPCLYCWH